MLTLFLHLANFIYITKTGVKASWVLASDYTCQ